MRGQWLRAPRLPALCVLVVVCLGPSSSSAQGTTSTVEGGAAAELPADYVALVNGALAEHRDGNFAEARALFLRAHALFPSARTLRGLGLVEFELHDYLASLRYLREALDSRVRPLSDTLRKDTERLVELARTFVGSYAIVVQPAGASVLVDEAPASLTSGPLLLSLGPHTLEVAAPGYLSARRVLTVRGAERETLSIALVREAALDSPRHDDRGRGRLYKNPWLWTAVSVVAIGAGTTLGVLLADS